MIERHDEEGEIREMLQKSVGTDEPPIELQRKLQLMAREASKPKRRWWTSRRTVLAFTAAGVAMVLTLTMMPSQAAAKTYGNLVAAAQRVKAFQFSIDSMEGGKREKFTITGADGKFAMRSGSEGLIMQFDNQSFSLYDADSNVVTRFKLGSLMDAKTIAQQMQKGVEMGLNYVDLKKILRDFEGKYGKDEIRISRVRTENGRDVYDALMESPKDPERVRIYVDAATDLPFQIISERRVGNGAWNVVSKIEMRYDKEVDPKALLSEIPANAKTMEVDLDGLVKDATKSVNALGPVIRKFDPSFKGIR